MTAKRWLIPGIAVVLLAGSGCEACGGKGFALAYQAGPSCDVPLSQRNHVYVFAVGSTTPSGVTSLTTLCDEISKRGFAKVAYAQTIYTSWMAKEMSRIHGDDEDAVFVILGSEAGGPTAVKLAESAILDGLPVAAFVLLDAEGKTTVPNLGTHVMIVGSDFGLASSSQRESVALSEVGRYSLPTDPRTISAVARLLNDLAQRTPEPIREEVLGWSFPQAPAARPIINSGKAVDWAYLFDQPGGTTEAIRDEVPQTKAPLSARLNTPPRR
jgi:hypothetical protein